MSRCVARRVARGSSGAGRQATLAQRPPRDTPRPGEIVRGPYNRNHSDACRRLPRSRSERLSAGGERCVRSQQQAPRADAGPTSGSRRAPATRRYRSRSTSSARDRSSCSPPTTPPSATFYSDPGKRLSKVHARTRSIRESEDGLAYIEQLYATSISEVCFIDRGGAENARFVDGVARAVR